MVNNSYQHVSKVSFPFVHKKQFGQLFNISPHSFAMLNTTNTEFLFVKIWFTLKNSQPYEIGDSVNMTLIIGRIDDSKNV